MDNLLSEYQFGIVIGAVGINGLMAVLEAVEVLVFGSMLYEWTQARAVAALIIGLLLLIGAGYLHWLVQKLDIYSPNVEYR